MGRNNTKTQNTQNRKQNLKNKKTNNYKKHRTIYQNISKSKRQKVNGNENIQQITLQLFENFVYEK